MIKTYKDQFGFLPLKTNIVFENGKITTLDTFDGTIKNFSKYFDSFGSFNPGLEMYKLSPTHKIFLDDLNGYNEIRQIRLNDGGFIIQLIAYIFGIRAQFHDWWFDSKIPCKRTHNIRFAKKTLSEFITHSYVTWKSWPENIKKLFTNILYMHSRFNSCHWDWEKFTVSYMVLDSCYKCSKELLGIKAKNHQERINTLCKTFKLKKESKNIERIVELRNQLFHESLWSNERPGTATKDDAFTQTYNLWRFNHRLIMALTGFKTDYIKSSWSCLGRYCL